MVTEKWETSRKLKTRCNEVFATSNYTCSIVAVRQLAITNCHKRCVIVADT